MTNRYLLLTLFLFSTTFATFGQGVGKLKIHADLSAIAAIDPEIEISVINLASNQEMARKKVSEGFDFNFPLNGRFLLYFKKEGYKTTRLMLDTHTFMSGNYYFVFEMNLNKDKKDANGLAIPVGSIVFDSYSSRFGYKKSSLLASQPVKVVSSLRESEVVHF